MSETARNDVLGNFFGGLGNNSWLICLVLILCLSGGTGCGIGGIGGLFGDQNLIFILIILLVLFGSGGFFRF